MASKQTETVQQGAWVKVTGFVPGEEEVYYLVPEGEKDYEENKIPPSSPLARVLEGSKRGEKVVFHPPGGQVELTVVDFGRQ